MKHKPSTASAYCRSFGRKGNHVGRQAWETRGSGNQEQPRREIMKGDKLGREGGSYKFTTIRRFWKSGTQPLRSKNLAFSYLGNNCCKYCITHDQKDLRSIGMEHVLRSIGMEQTFVRRSPGARGFDPQPYMLKDRRDLPPNGHGPPPPPVVWWYGGCPSLMLCKYVIYIYIYEQIESFLDCNSVAKHLLPPVVAMCC